MEEYMQKATEICYMYGPRFITAILIFIIGKWIAKWISILLAKAMQRSKVDSTLVCFMKNLSYSLMLVVVAITAPIRSFTRKNAYSFRFSGNEKKHAIDSIKRS
jgi:small conductance mechanosensitive channel